MTRRKRFRVVLIVTVLIGLAYFASRVLVPAAIVAFMRWGCDSQIARTEQTAPEWVLHNAYPGSTLIRADSEVFDWHTANTVEVRVLVTLESTASFDAIKSWYVQHPEQWIVYGPDFPQGGLEKLDGERPVTTRYRVTYHDTDSCLVGGERPLHQIR